jgi:hypothetical protein
VSILELIMELTGWDGSAAVESFLEDELYG